MALPGNNNPFEKRLTEKPPETSSSKKEPIKFTKVPLSTGVISDEEKKAERCSADNNKNQSTVNQPSTNRQSTVNYSLDDSIKISSQEGREDKKTISDNKDNLTKPNYTPIVEPQPSINRQLTVNDDKVEEGPTVNQPSTNRQYEKPNKQDNRQCIRQPTDNQLSTNRQLKPITGLKKKLMDYLCEIRLLTGTEWSHLLTHDDVALILKSSVRVQREIVYQLAKENYFEVECFSRGKTGLRKFKIISEYYSEFLTLNGRLPSINRQPTVNQPSTEPSIGPSSKLVSNINNNLLTSVEPKGPTSENDDQLDIIAINIEPLQKFNITRKQIQDIKNQKLNFTTSTLQDFVDRFIIYTSEPKNIKGVNSIPAIFVRMAQLAAKGQDPLVDIETDADRLIRERLERLKMKQEERLKQKQELLEIEFEEWLAEAELDVINKIAPPTAMMKQGSVAQKMTLKSYFVENVWNQKTGNIFFKQLEN